MSAPCINTVSVRQGAPHLSFLLEVPLHSPTPSWFIYGRKGSAAVTAPEGLFYLMVPPGRRLSSRSEACQLLLQPRRALESGGAGTVLRGIQCLPHVTLLFRSADLPIVQQWNPLMHRDDCSSQGSGRLREG